MAKEWHCEEFERTGLPRPATIEKACKICPLRNEKGDCIKDIVDDLANDLSDKASKEISLIWEAFYGKR